MDLGHVKQADWPIGRLVPTIPSTASSSSLLYGLKTTITNLTKSGYEHRAKLVNIRNGNLKITRSKKERNGC